jgi:fatty acid amide hydrolase 2
LNCVADQRFLSAIEDARRVDRIIASLRPANAGALEELEKETPFLGVPFSTEEGIRTQGMLCMQCYILSNGFHLEKLEL